MKYITRSWSFFGGPSATWGGRVTGSPRCTTDESGIGGGDGPEGGGDGPEGGGDGPEGGGDGPKGGGDGPKGGGDGDTGTMGGGPEGGGGVDGGGDIVPTAVSTMFKS